jgi:Zinc finger, C2H2 type/C2H2-type zinc finger
MTEFICDDCDTRFTTNQSLKYHTKHNVCRKEKEVKEYICDICDKELSSRTSLYRHKRNVCKERKKTLETADVESDKIAKIYDMLIKMKEENDELKVKVTRMSKEPTVNNIMNMNNNNCNINNGTVNNFYLVGYGKEDMEKIDYNDILKGIKSGFHSTYNLIDTVHFNPNYPEFHNVYISSMKNKYAMMYDGDNWTLVMKDALIDKLYDDKRNYIEENLDDFIDSLSNSQKNALYRWMDADDDHDYIRKIKNDIKLMLYNKRNLPINNKGNMIEYIDEQIDIVDIDDDVEGTAPISNTKVIHKELKKPKKRPRKKLAIRTGLKRKTVRVTKRSNSIGLTNKY